MSKSASISDLAFEWEVESFELENPGYWDIEAKVFDLTKLETEEDQSSVNPLLSIVEGQPVIRLQNESSYYRVDGFSQSSLSLSCYLLLNKMGKEYVRLGKVTLKK